jgi:thymidylate synthase
MIISEQTAIEAWKKALSMIKEKGKDFVDQDNRICRQYLNMIIEIKNPTKGITEPIELLNSMKTWKYPRLEEIANVMLSSKLSLDYAYSYGSRIFSFRKKVDQVNEYVIPLLKKNPTSRRAIVTLWEPEEDSMLIKKEVPGLVCLDFIIEENKLCMTGIIRSNDVFFGWPANVYQLYMLQEHVSKKLDIEIGNLTVFSVSAHIFKEQFEFIDKIIKK